LGPNWARPSGLTAAATAKFQGDYESETWNYIGSVVLALGLFKIKAFFCRCYRHDIAVSVCFSTKAKVKPEDETGALFRLPHGRADA
jgi:hypothetical protein